MLAPWEDFPNPIYDLTKIYDLTQNLIVGEFLFYGSFNLSGMNFQTLCMRYLWTVLYSKVRQKFQFSKLALYARSDGKFADRIFTLRRLTLNEISFPAPFSKLFRRYVVLVTATEFSKPWITV